MKKILTVLMIASFVLINSVFAGTLQEDIRAAKAGNLKAQVALGDRFLRGSGVKKNPASAAHWYKKAADKGLPEAQFKLGELYDTGIGVNRDTDEAEKLYKKAADGGYELAKAKLETYKQLEDGRHRVKEL